MRRALPFILSLTGGYVDTAGFLALGGLFTAHVTGNFVTLGAALTLGTSGTIAKLLALPVFCLTIFLLRFVARHTGMAGDRGLRTMLSLQLILLIAGGGLAVGLGPFSDPDGLPLVATGMLLVMAMAIQNAVHRIHLASAPPTTLMTGTTTQIMIDLADVAYGGPAEDEKPVRTRLSKMALAVAAFALGCGSAALAFVHLGTWCLALPPFLGLASLTLALMPPETP